MEQEMTTREKIIYETLKLFSEKGYDGVSMREIAAAVGIKGASIYNHFKGKEMIFEEIFKEVTKRYDSFAQGMNIPMLPNEETARLYLSFGEAQLLAAAEGLFSFFTQDEFVVMFRKLITAEQRKFSMAEKFLKEYYFDAPIRFQAEIFRGMQQGGGFEGFDADIMALHFYSPVYFILNKYDLEGNYEECLAQLKMHVHWFCKLYGRDTKNE